MFFIIELIIPLLRDKHDFSDQVNITIDFGNKDADTELIRFIMYYFNMHYPLILAKVNVVNFEFGNLKKNYAFRTELDVLDLFRVRSFY
jgi:hypothetical protein